MNMFLLSAPGSFEDLRSIVRIRRGKHEIFTPEMIMVLILDGNSLPGAHVKRNLYYSPCLRAFD